MDSERPRFRVRAGGHRALHVLVAFPIACFCGALVTDIVYALTAVMMWADFSDWLLAVGMIVGVIAALAGIVAGVANRRLLTRRQVWPVAIGSLIVLVLGFFDNLVHTRDAWTSVVPVGLALSAVTVLAVLVTVWLGIPMAYREDIELPYPGVRK